MFALCRRSQPSSVLMCLWICVILMFFRVWIISTFPHVKLRPRVGKTGWSGWTIAWVLCINVRPSFCCLIHTYTGFLVLGASDDAVSCAVMLEVLHSLANQSTPFHHGVIFLFNGAEENILQVKWSDTNTYFYSLDVRTSSTRSSLPYFGLTFDIKGLLSFGLSYFLFHQLFCLSFFLFSSFRPVTVSLLSIPGPSRCEPSLTWRLQVSGARRLFSRQVLYSLFPTNWPGCLFSLCFILHTFLWAALHQHFSLLLSGKLANESTAVFLLATIYLVAGCHCSVSIWISNLIMDPKVPVTMHLYVRHYLMYLLDATDMCCTLNKLNCLHHSPHSEGFWFVYMIWIISLCDYFLLLKLSVFEIIHIWMNRWFCFHFLSHLHQNYKTVLLLLWCIQEINLQKIGLMWLWS